MASSDSGRDGGRLLAVDAFSELAILTLMVIALLLPVADFFGKKRSLPSGVNQSTAE